MKCTILKTILIHLKGCALNLIFQSTSVGTVDLDHSYTHQLSMWIMGTSVSQHELLSNLFKVFLVFTAEYEC